MYSTSAVLLDDIKRPASELESEAGGFTDVILPRQSKKYGDYLPNGHLCHITWDCAVNRAVNHAETKDRIQE